MKELEKILWISFFNIFLNYNIVTLHIRPHDGQQQEAIDLQALNVNRNNVHVWEVLCTLNVNSEDKSRSILHGTFYASDNPYKVLAMYKVGQTYSLKRGQEEEEEKGKKVILTRITEQRLDLLLLRQPTENDLDTHPIGYVLRFNAECISNGEEVAQKENNAEDRIKELMNKQRGYLLITSGNEVVLSSAVFNAGAQRVELLFHNNNLIFHKNYIYIGLTAVLED